MPKLASSRSRPRPHGLARWLSKYGLASRAEARRWVLEGRVSLNGKLARDPDRPCHPGRDAIRVDGRPLRPAAKVYLALHKPVGYITTSRDPAGRPTAYDLLPPDRPLLHAVGRLDADTSGLLLFTNDTDFAARVTEAGGPVEKVYRARLRGRVSEEDRSRFESGSWLDGRPTLPARCQILAGDSGSTRVEISLGEGRNRQIRRMWEKLGHPVLELERIRIGPVRLSSLPAGRTRPLTRLELRALLARRRRLLPGRRR
jgi:23S rRNA pseudouridine2605 synthase